MLASRAFIEFVMTSQVSRDLLTFLDRKAFAEEVFFATLNYNPHLGAPGAFTGSNRNSNNSTPSFASVQLYMNAIFRTTKEPKSACLAIQVVGTHVGAVRREISATHLRLSSGRLEQNVRLKRHCCQQVRQRLQLSSNTLRQ